MRYLLAKGVLSDLSHLLALVHASREGPSGRAGSRSDGRGSQPSRPEQAFRAVGSVRALLRLLDGVAGLMDALMVFSFCPAPSGASEGLRPCKSRSGIVTHALGSTSATVSHGVVSTMRAELGRSRSVSPVPPSDRDLAAGVHPDKGEMIAPISGSLRTAPRLFGQQRGGEGGVCGGAKACSGKTGARVIYCKRLDDLNAGNLSARPDCARMVMGVPEVVRVMTTLILLLASVVVTDRRR